MRLPGRNYTDWLCSKCYCRNKEYSTLCGHCYEDRGVWKWLYNIDNPAFYLAVIAFIVFLNLAFNLIMVILKGVNYG